MRTLLKSAVVIVMLSCTLWGLKAGDKIIMNKYSQQITVTLISEDTKTEYSINIPSDSEGRIDYDGYNAKSMKAFYNFSGYPLYGALVNESVKKSKLNSQEYFTFTDKGKWEY